MTRKPHRCRCGTAQALFRNADGVVLIQQKLLELRAVDATLPSKLTLATLRAVWKCVVQNRKNLVRLAGRARVAPFSHAH